MGLGGVYGVGVGGVRDGRKKKAEYRRGQESNESRPRRSGAGEILTRSRRNANHGGEGEQAMP